MALPKTKTWKLDDHTRGKHEVLRRYLEAWFPVLGSWAGRILFIDGFAGPGEYSAGEHGSPAIALKVLTDHTAKRSISAEIGFIFIEQDEARLAHLKGVCQRLQPGLPRKCWISVERGRFDEEMSNVLDQLDEQKESLAPAFVMVDPFGVSGTPMAVLHRIMRNPRCEVYVSLMYESINRFKESDEFEGHLDALFGSKRWREGVEIADAQARRDFLYDLYRTQLKKGGAEHVVHFDLYEGRRLVYAIFFATRSLKGCDLMKRAIWDVAPFGDYAFRGSHVAKLGPGLFGIDLRPLQKAIAARYSSKGWVRVEDVSAYVASDACDFHTGHLKSQLKEMEEAGLIQVDAASRKRKLTYPDGTRLRISKAHPN